MLSTNPNSFLGLVYCVDEPDVVTLLFGSGKVVITSGKEPGEAEQAIEQIQDDLDEFGLLG